MSGRIRFFFFCKLRGAASPIGDPGFVALIRFEIIAAGRRGWRRAFSRFRVNFYRSRLPSSVTREQTKPGSFVDVFSAQTFPFVTANGVLLSFHVALAKTYARFDDTICTRVCIRP